MHVPREPRAAAAAVDFASSEAVAWNSIRSCCRACSSRSSSRSTSCCRRSPSGSRRTSSCSRACTSGSGDATYLRLSLFWTKMFAVSFGMGVVSGIVMPFQFGTNWSGLADTAGNVLAPLLTYEGPDRVLPRGRIPRHPAVRPQAGAAVGPPVRRRDGRVGHAVLVVLDPVGQQLDADAGRLRDRRRALLREGLGRRDLQSVVPVPDRAHGDRVLHHHRLRGRRGFRVAPAPAAARAGVAARDVDGAGPARSCWCRCRSSWATRTASTRSNTSRSRSPRWKACGTRRRARPPSLFAIPDSAQRIEPVRDRDPGSRQRLPDARRQRRGQGTEGVPAGRPPAGRHCVLGVPRHGRDGRPDARRRRVGRVAAPARSPVRRRPRTSSCATSWRPPDSSL